MLVFKQLFAIFKVCCSILGKVLQIIVPRSWGLYYKALQIDKMYGEWTDYVAS